MDGWPRNDSVRHAPRSHAYLHCGGTADTCVVRVALLLLFSVSQVVSCRVADCNALIEQGPFMPGRKATHWYVLHCSAEDGSRHASASLPACLPATVWGTGSGGNPVNLPGVSCRL